ncbi:MAG: pectate lyase [Chloroflexi bacterium]|nr:pectate lyase [Chloroflexota bacterium]
MNYSIDRFLVKAIAIFLISGCTMLTTEFVYAQSSVGIPAFPTAEGFGRFAKGGRGGSVIHVTNLNDSGAGSLRACVTTSGPRTCVFDVGGTIALTSQLKVYNPYLTIAGQTAPGDGILVKGATIIIKTNDVIMRHLRLRAGAGVVDPTSSSSLSVVGNEARNIIADHISASWHPDESAEIWGSIQNVTYQWNIISEGLNCTGASPTEPCHGKGLLTGGGNTRYSIVKCLLAHNNDRNGLIKDGDVEFINNVIYNYRGDATVFVPERLKMRIDVVGNYYKPGPSSGTTLPPVRPPVGFQFSNTSYIYVKGNLHPVHRPNDDMSETAIFKKDAGGTLVTTRHPFPGVANETSAAQASIDVLAGAGATVPKRDSVDLRIVSDVQNGTGSIIDFESEVGGFPDMANASRPSGFDSDNDGMPNAWEVAHRLDANDSSDGNQIHANGYTNVENYLNELAGDPIPGFSEEIPAQPMSPTNLTVTQN